MEVITPDATNLVLTIVASVVGMLWTLFKTTEFYKSKAEKESGRALLALEAGVEAAYTGFVKQAKEAAADGKLTVEERTTAKKFAIDHARILLGKEGIDLVKALGEDYIGILTEKVLGVAKGTTPSVLPNATNGGSNDITLPQL